MRWLGAVALGLALVALARPLPAHPMPNSLLWIDFGQTDVRIEAILPVNELRHAYGPVPSVLPPGAARTALATYLLRHIGAATTDGRPWNMTISGLALLPGGNHDDLRATLVLRPPPDASARSFVLRDDAITHQVMSHVILVFARSDLPGGALDEEPALIGAMQNPVRTLAIARDAARPLAAFRAAFLLGMRHVAGGADHILFLVTLMLAAPLVAVDGRWRGRKTLRATLADLAKIVSGFTIGHSITLVLGAASQLRVPQAPVEVLIALSIIAAAAEVWRPWFGARAHWMAAAFGLVHGLSFAAVIGGYLLDPWAKAQAILAFNLGIEAIQLSIVAVVAPPLVLIARIRAGDPIRLGAAAGAALIAAWWTVERLA